MVPHEYVVPYLISNGVALTILLLAFRRPTVVRWIWMAIFTWAAGVNTWTATREPWAYLAYAALTPSAVYRHFIEGWFSQNIPWVVLPIAAGQFAIATLLFRGGQARRLGVVGAVTFLLAIAPLGIGSGFPFSLTGGLSLIVMEWRLTARRRRGVSPASRFIRHPDVVDEHVIDIHAPASVVFDVATHADLLANHVVATLVRIRGLVMRDPARPRPARGLVAETLGLGWGVLQFASGRTLVMGAVARPWARAVTFTAVDPGGFEAFHEPNLVKIVWTLEAEPIGEARTRFRTETRVQATDLSARRRFRIYWLVVSPGIRLIRWAILRDVRREAERRRRAATVPALSHAA